MFKKRKMEEDFMEKVVEFLQENPVQYLATVGRDGKAKCRPFMFAGQMANFGSAPTTQRMSTRICRKIRRLRSPYPAQLMHGSVCMEKQFLRTTCRQKKCASPILLSRASMGPRITQFLKYFIWKMRMV